MESTLPRHLERSELFDFVRALVAVVSTHTFAVYSYSIGTNFARRSLESAAFPWFITVFSLTVAVVFAAWFKYGTELKGAWPWIALLGYVALLWITEAIDHLLRAWEGGTSTSILFPSVAVPSLCILLWFAYKKALAATYANIAVKQTTIPCEPVIAPQELTNPAGLIPVIGSPELTKAAGLILFLSPLGVPDAWAKSLPAPLGDAQAAKAAYLNHLLQDLPSDADFGNRKSLSTLSKVTWYMPLLAIGVHLTIPPVTNTLYVVVIPSADSTRPGTWREVDNFKELVHRLAKPHSWKVEVEVLSEHAKGVAYEKLEDIGRAVNRAKAYLREKDLPGPVVIDITSGQATCSAVGTALSFARKENIEYVSTVNYNVQLYDLRYEPQCSPVND